MAMRLNTVQKWWNQVGQYGYSERLGVRSLPYDKLSVEEKHKVYHYFSTGEIENKVAG